MPSSTNHPACPGRAALHQPPARWDTLCALAGHRGSAQVILGHEVKPHEWSNTTSTQRWPTFPPPPRPSIKLDNMAYFISVPPWLLQLFGSIFSPAHYFLTPPQQTLSEHKLRSAVTQRHRSSEEEGTVKRSVTPLQRDANYVPPYAEAGQASCDCSTKPPGRRKRKDQGQEEKSKCYRRERFPQQLQRPLQKKTAHVSQMHMATGWPRSWCWSKEQRSQPSTRHLEKRSMWQPCSLRLKFICKA